MKFVILAALLLAGTFSYAQNAIDTTEIVLIGGIKQVITIQGRDRSLPLLLYLHGGPGGSVMDYAHKFTDQLQKHFVVIQWDQRETGRTLELNRSPIPLTVSIFENDTHELITSLLKRFVREKIYLAAHSWGTALGFHIAEKHADLLYAYLPIGPMVNQLESERIALGIMKKKALQTGNRTQQNELSTVKVPFENWEQLYYHRKWLLDYAGSSRALSRDYVEQWARIWLDVFNEASHSNLIQELPTIGCPVYFFVGRKDLQTNAAITENYFSQLAAPRKALFWFNEAGHAVPTKASRRLQQLIIEKVLPETYAIQEPDAVIGQSSTPAP